MAIKGVIFDFNGTMLYDSDLQETSWRIFLCMKTGRAVTDHEFLEYVHGRNANITLSYFFDKTLSSDEIEQLAEEKEVIYRELCLKNKSRFNLIKGLPEFLDTLKQSKIPFTIATASGLTNVKFFFQHLNLDKWFNIEAVIYDDGKLPGKPEPCIYEKAAQQIEVLPRDCIVFEDAKSGVIAAQRAAIGKIIGVTERFAQNPLRETTGLNHVISDYYNAYSLIFM